MGFRDDCPLIHAASASVVQDPLRSDMSALGILCVTTGCTLLVYGLIEAVAALLRTARRGRNRTFECSAAPGVACIGACGSGSYGACGYDGMRALEAGWAPVLAITDGRGYSRGKVAVPEIARAVTER